MTRASRTAVLVCQARAVADGRLAVGRFADPVAVRLLDENERRPVESARGGRIDDWRDRIVNEFLLSTVDVLVSRTVTIDDAVRVAGHSQVVVLGAGLDARAWRMAELSNATVFEVDQPASQAEKRRRTADVEPVASRVAFVPVEFGVDDLCAALTAADHDPNRPTTWIWEGVLPYLTDTQVGATLRDIAVASCPGSTLIATYPTRHRVGGLLNLGLKLIFAIANRPNPMASERHVSAWTPDRMRDILADHGFSVTSDVGQADAASDLDYVPHRPDTMARGRIVVAVR
ncbi:hypothetical protein nbrc107696_00250 [Gordonia spumicola]|uniref:S-adenosyl-L-methionine-dependent methyltransferase n=1 Tax=Gordonia spumicola TaxID=589161 RepID=A0A7I9V2D2_9ACTN|nr:class I SAM-dependent methyltransferase [Gordonia spumicola]GED99578.1 hypothetical protein nbrc107696_00250 [Gordonia spumicola]